MESTPQSDPFGVSSPRLSPQGPPAHRLVKLALGFYGVMALVAWGWRVGLDGESLGFATPAAAQVGVRWLRDLGAGLAAAALVIRLSREFTQRTRAGADLARSLAEALGRLSTGQILILALLSGSAEEMFFRGAVQPHLGLVATSLLFGAVHFVPQKPFLPWTAFAVAAGFLLGGLLVATGNLVAPVVAHVVINAVNLRRLVAGGWEEDAP